MRNHVDTDQQWKEMSLGGHSAKVDPDFVFLGCWAALNFAL